MLTRNPQAPECDFAEGRVCCGSAQVPCSRSRASSRISQTWRVSCGGDKGCAVVGGQALLPRIIGVEYPVVKGSGSQESNAVLCRFKSDYAEVSSSVIWSGAAALAAVVKVHRARSAALCRGGAKAWLCATIHHQPLRLTCTTSHSLDRNTCKAVALLGAGRRVITWPSS